MLFGLCLYGGIGSFRLLSLLSVPPVGFVVAMLTVELALALWAAALLFASPEPSELGADELSKPRR